MAFFLEFFVSKVPLMSIMFHVDDYTMSRNPFIAAFAGLIIILAGVAGCGSKPETLTETQDEPDNVPVTVPENDVWAFLARGELDKVQALFMGEMDVNARSPNGQTPLHIAAANKNHAMAAFFTALGADVNALDRQGRTPLDISAELLDAQTAKVLANAGSNIHHQMRGNASPAIIGVRDNSAFLQGILNPQSIESTDASGKTVLHLASEYGKISSLNLIMSAGVKDLTKKDNNGRTALDIALSRTDSRNHAEIADSLILAGAVSNMPLYSYFAPAVRTANFNVRSADGMAPLHYMVREGFTGYIAYAHERNANINIKNASGATPLHEAVRSGNINVIELLMRLGADISAEDAKGNSVLHIAAPFESCYDIAQLLISGGAGPNNRDEHGDTPLHIAVILNRPPEYIRLLLENGSDPGIRNVNGKTPLYLAVEAERGSIIPMLLSWNSDIYAVDTNGLTPFEIALTVSNSVLPLLITDETVHQVDSQGNNMLHLTIKSGIDAKGGANIGDVNVIDLLLDSSVPVNARNKEGDTGLHLAVRLNDKIAGTMLLDHGADIFAPNSKGESPLFLAFPVNGNGSVELREWMFYERTFAARDGLRNTILHYAAQWRYDRWIPRLVESGANIEAINVTGETPLFTAVKFNSPSTIRALVLAHARLDSRDILGNTALHAAVQWNAVNAAEALINLGLDVNGHAFNGKTPLHDAVRNGTVQIETLLIANGADLEARDADGNTVFMEAILAGLPLTMERLVDRGSNTNIRNFRGDTPLHLAAAMERIDIAVLLMNWGASIHARNSMGRTPFQNAIAATPDMVAALLTRDQINRTDDYGSSPLHIAVQERASVDTISAILALNAGTNTLDSSGRTPVRLAVDTMQWNTVRLLANSGADIFLEASDGKTTAEIILNSGDNAIRTVFSGRTVFSRDISGNTILHYAARTGNINVISGLLELGADKNTLNYASESAADIAQRWRHPQAVNLLRIGT